MFRMCSISLQNGRPVGQQVGRPVGWTASRQIGRSVYRPAGLPVGQSAARRPPVVRAVSRQVGRSVGWSTGRSAGRPAHRPAHRPVDRVGPASWNTFEDSTFLVTNCAPRDCVGSRPSQKSVPRQITQLHSTRVTNPIMYTPLHRYHMPDPCVDRVSK